MIFELMQYAERNKIDAIILILDFQKCFDKIDFSALFGALEYFCFPQYIINWTKILYCQFQACTQNNGYFSKRFNIERGVHQGGPCSSFYFLLCTEIMAIMLRKNQDIKGIPVNEILNLLGQYADDADIYSLFDKKSYESIFQCLERFRSISGFTLNYDKTSIFRIGSLKNSDSSLVSQTTVSWTNQPINVLGVWVANDSDTTLKLNYQSMESKINSILSDWTNRNGSLIGKVQVVNSLIISLCVYKMMVLPHMPESQLKQIHEKIVHFIWKGAKPKIRYETLILDKAKGGLGLCDLVCKDKALKASWAQIIANDIKLANIVYANIAPNLKEKLWSCSLDEKDVGIFVQDTFWKEVFESWFEFKRIADVLTKSGEELIWCNSGIRVMNKPILWTKKLERGLLYVTERSNFQPPSLVDLFAPVPVLRSSSPVTRLLDRPTGITQINPLPYIFSYFHCYFGTPCPTPGGYVSLETIPRGGGGGRACVKPLSDLYKTGRSSP